MHRTTRLRLALALLATLTTPTYAQEPTPPTAAPSFAPMDVFSLEWADDPRISPDGGRVAYERHSMDVMTDRPRSEIWQVGFDGTGHRPLVPGAASSPRWSPDGTRLAYVAAGHTVDAGEPASAQILVRYLGDATAPTARVAQLTEAPRSLAWSPDGLWLAFVQHVPTAPESWVSIPKPPEGAQWAESPRVVENLVYRADGRGYLRPGNAQVFVVPAEGGTPRQVTFGPYDHNGPVAWSADGRSLVVSANREDDRDLDPQDSELYEIRLDTPAGTDSDTDGGASIRPLTDRQGPDSNPVVSPDGRHIAYLGFDDRYQGYQVTRLYLLDRSTGRSRVLTGTLDRDVRSPTWSPDSRHVYFLMDELGNTRLARVAVGGAGEGRIEEQAHDVGGTTLGRPYASGSFDVGPNGRLVFTRTRPEHPADLVALTARARATRDAPNPLTSLTDLNGDLLPRRRLATVEETFFKSSHDGREIQGWIAYPPGFDPTRKYPLLLEIHGGPFANYGDRFAAEIQLYAAAGYVVLYTNPRGSTSYGEAFGNLIHHAYPGYDYDDLMSGVDTVLAQGFVDPERLFVTGGSGGGVLSAWIVGKTDRFRAAAVQKPVIHWTSFVFTSDAPGFFYKYWFPGLPWENPEAYRERSPLYLVPNVTTPTLVITGEEDYRTPISESEQLYTALKLVGVDTALVRIPGAGHSIAARPSRLIAKVAHVLGWFARYGGPGGENDD